MFVSSQVCPTRKKLAGNREENVVLPSDIQGGRTFPTGAFTQRPENDWDIVDINYIAMVFEPNRDAFLNGLLGVTLNISKR
jgi:hypothetical protein